MSWTKRLFGMALALGVSPLCAKDLPTVIAENDINYSLTARRAYNLSQHGRGVDTHSRLGTPMFVGGSSPASPNGFALAAGSPGKNAGSDGKDDGR